VLLLEIFLVAGGGGKISELDSIPFHGVMVFRWN
jgi:hypothetical protein